MICAFSSATVMAASLSAIVMWMTVSTGVENERTIFPKVWKWREITGVCCGMDGREVQGILFHDILTGGGK